MTETSTTTADGAFSIGAPERPRTINLALILIIVAVGFALLAALSWLGHESQFIKLFIDTNNKLSASKRVKNYDSAKALSDLHRQRKNILIQAGVISVAMLFLVFAMTKARTASAARWGYVIVTVLTALGSVIPYPGVPVLLNVGRVGQGVCELAAVILLFLPTSRQYFRACKGLGAQDPDARPRLRMRELLNPGARAAAAAASAAERSNTRTATRPTVSVTKTGASDADGPVRNRAKNRSEQAAVAKGAELARARAKASKSRRSDPNR